MIKNMNISSNSADFSLLAVNLLVVKIFTEAPLQLVKAAGTTASLSALFWGAFSVLVLFLLCLFFYRYTDGNILNMSKVAFGIWGKRIVALVASAYLVSSLCFVLKDSSELIRLVAFPTSPDWFVPAFLVLGGILGAMCSIPAILRIHSVFVPIVISVLLLLIGSTILPFDQAEYSVNIPANTHNLFDGAASQFLLYTDILLIFLLSPGPDDRPYMAKRVATSGIFALFLYTAMLLAFTLKVSPAVIPNGQFPIYLLMKEVYFGRFFQRLDAVILMTSAFSAMLFSALGLHLLSLCVNQGTCIPPSKILPLIFGGLVFVFAAFDWPLSSSSFIHLTYIFAVWIVAILILGLILIKVRRSTNEKL